MSKWEKKFGKFAIPNLTLVLIMGYVVGYILNLLAPSFMNYLTLDTYAILHGQIWRLVTWVIAPPTALTTGSLFGMNLVMVLIMLYFSYNIGTMLERIWGTWRYNVYIFTGMFLTVVGAFLCMGIYYLTLGNALTPSLASQLFAFGAYQYSTYYVNLSIFMAFAITLPDSQVLLMMVIPVKAKWMAIIEIMILVLDMIQYMSLRMWFSVMAIGASLLNFLIFYLRVRGKMKLNPKQIKRRVEFKQDIRRNPKITKHKCAVCGQTDQDSPDLEFRFCSKCNGNYEYCQNHLFTHTHVK